MGVLSPGANTTVGSTSALNGLVLGVRWGAASIDCDLVALVCDEDKKVLSDDHLVFFNNLVSSDRAVYLRQLGADATTSGDRAQIQVHLAALPPRAQQVVVALTTLEAGVSLTSVSGIVVDAFDPTSGEVLAQYEVGPEKAGTACLILVEVYRRKGDWKVRAVGQGYDSGLAGLGRDYGVQLED